MAITATALTIGSMAITYGMIYAAVAVAAIVASTAMSITSGVQQANQQKAYANYQKAVNEQNAKAARAAAQAQVENMRIQNKFTNGTALAKLGGMGALAEGSPLLLLGQDVGQQEYDMLVTEYNGDVQATQFQQKAALNKYEADVADYNLGLNTAATVTKGIGSIASTALGASSLLGGSTGLSTAKNVGDFSTSSGGLITAGKDYFTGDLIT